LDARKSKPWVPNGEVWVYHRYDPTNFVVQGDDVKQREISTICLVFGTFVLANGAIAQQPPPASAVKKTTPTAVPKKSPTPQSASAPKPQGLTVDGIIAMAQAGLSDDVIVARLRKEDKAFDLSPEEMIKLKKAGVGDDTLVVMMDPKAELKPPPSPTIDPPTAVAPPVPVPAVTPTPSSNVASAVTATPKAPSIPTEIGVYFKKADTWTEVLPEVVNWKTGGALKNIASAGVVKKDVNGNIAGPGSRNSIGGPLEFLIVAAEGVSITEYQLIRLRLNKDYREFRTVTGGILNQQSGAMRDMVPFEGKKLSPRTFSVVLPNNLGSGEYGFLSPGAVGSSGNSQAQIGKMYTFRVLE
jgi:hypothetical protein